MPLTPQAQAVLEALDGLPWPPLEKMTAEAFRRVSTLGAVVPPDDPRLTIRSLNLARAGGELKLRLYAPAEARLRAGVLFCHGGGFVSGDLDSHDNLCRALALTSDVAVISVDYRLAPEHPFPAGLTDVVAALIHVRDHGREFDVDATRLAVAGDSAGGALAALAAARAREMGAPLRHQLLIYPVTDLVAESPSYSENAEGCFLTRDLMRWFRAQYLGARAAETALAASPLHITEAAGLPPATVITAQYDPLRDEGEAYAKRLAAAGIDVVQQRFEGVFHGFASMLGLLPEADAALALAARRLQEALA